MIYSHCKFKGLGLFRSQWEAQLQQINSLRMLHRHSNLYITATRDVVTESINCLCKLQIKPDNSFLSPKDGFLDPRKIRNFLRDMEYNKWCELPTKGKGIILFQEYPPINKLINRHVGLSISEWRDGIKMIGNVTAVRATPGRTMDTNHCRHCHNEIETLSHVLGSCPHGETLRNARHHKIRSSIAKALRDSGFKVYEEVHGLSTCGSSRRIDMIAFNNNKMGYIIDPTVRFETSKNQPDDVNNEKKQIYEPTIPYYIQEYKLESIEVIGILIGARGTIPHKFVCFCKDFHLPNSLIQSVALTSLKYSIYILRNHLYQN